MNFHIFVFITTVVFYIVLRSYKSQITHISSDPVDLKKSPRSKTQNKQTQQSNLIYVLFIPAILYIVKFLYGCSTNVTLTQFDTGSSNGSTSNSDSVVSERLLTFPYPDSSVNVSSVSNN